jgi:hypothetical protein
MWLQGGGKHYSAFNEIEKIKQNVLEEKAKKKSLSALLSAKGNLKSVLIVMGLYLLSTTTGVSAMTAYASMMFPPSDHLTSNEYTILYGAAKLVAVIVSLFVIEKFNRRSLLIVSFLICSFCNGSAYVLYYFDERNHQITFFPWLIFGAITLYSSIFAFVYPALYVIRGELLPFSVKTVGGSVAVIVQSSTSFAISKTFFPIEQYFGKETNFLIYFVMSLVTTIYIYFVLPETRGKALVDMRKSKSSAASLDFSFGWDELLSHLVSGMDSSAAITSVVEGSLGLAESCGGSTAAEVSASTDSGFFFFFFCFPHFLKSFSVSFRCFECLRAVFPSLMTKKMRFEDTRG